ncbi:hypothetical protein [Fervidicoccus fontis]|jgi:hypothetical protein|uniref:Preprotein translocase subunit SecB n=2 Tax=Fervidicoccus fontis TaxID=683846 RepID=I0A192_FERFK|nr:hypothetical protein [Fervidicoccus fontis]AFH42749.1 hypothetical protein FFONT_0761 [Fervidicoccus fontis Kam940]
MVQISTERISAEKVSEIPPPMMRYNTQLNVTKISEDPHTGIGAYEFRISLLSDPMVVNIVITGKVRIQAQNQDEIKEIFTKKSNEERANFVAGLVLPHLMGTLILISRELQVPPPLPMAPPPPQKTKEDFHSI